MCWSRKCMKCAQCIAPRSLSGVPVVLGWRHVKQLLSLFFVTKPHPISRDYILMDYQILDICPRQQKYEVEHGLLQI